MPTCWQYCGPTAATSTGTGRTSPGRGHHRPRPSTHECSTSWFPWPCTPFEQHANNPIEADHGRLKARLRPMHGLKRQRSVGILAAGQAFVQNLRRGHYDIATESSIGHRLRIAFDDLALTI